MPEMAEVIGTITVTVTNSGGFSHCFSHPEVGMLEKEASKLGANGLAVGGSSTRMFSGCQVAGIAFFVPVFFKEEQSATRHIFPAKTRIGCKT